MYLSDLPSSITPQSASTSSRRFITLQTRMTGLEPSHEWYRVSLAIGHPSSFPLNDSTPWITLKYRNDVSGDIQRRMSLCGATNSLYYSIDGPCDYTGNNGALYQKYGMDPRLFLGSDQITVNGTEILLELEIVWPVGSPSIPVFVDALRAWEIRWGTISR